MKNCKIFVIPGGNGGTMLLGREARDYVALALDGAGEYGGRVNFETIWTDADGVRLSENYICAAVFDDMPLVSLDAIAHYIDVMSGRGARHLRLPGGAFISRGVAPDEGISVKDEAFLKLGDAKSYNMVYNLLKERIIRRHLSRGALIYDANTTYIDDAACIEKGARILPFCRIEGDSRVEAGATVAASYVRDSVVEVGATVEYSYLTNSCVHARATVGPFARLRDADIGEGCRIGDFVEVKASSLAEGVKAAHLAYIGDAQVGERTNVGCGAVFCNYDGRRKHPTKVGSSCFIGANVNLVAPLSVGDEAYVAAGTTVTEDIPDSHFAIGRSRQQTKSPRVEK